MAEENENRWFKCPALRRALLLSFFLHALLFAPAAPLAFRTFNFTPPTVLAARLGAVALPPAQINERQVERQARSRPELSSPRYSSAPSVPSALKTSAPMPAEADTSLDRQGVAEFRLSLALAMRALRPQLGAQQGRVVVRIGVAANGFLLPPEIAHSSGQAKLDALVLLLMRQASAQVVLPASLQGQAFALTLPVEVGAL